MSNHNALIALAASLSCCGALLLTTPSARSAAVSSQMTQAQQVQVKEAWIRWLPGGVPLAGYATLANPSDQPSVLTSATSSTFRDVSLHQTVRSGGTVRMSPLEKLTIEPHTTLDFAARGIHMMLMQPRETLDPRGQIPITLHFADGSILTLQFQVRTSASASDDGGE